MRPTKIGERVEVDLFGLRAGSEFQFDDGVGRGTIIALAPGTITVRLDLGSAVVTIGPARVLSRSS